MDGFATKPWPSRNCVYNINLRQSEARFQRERCRVEKEIRGLERVYKQNVRKLNAAQRGVITMLGHDPYPNCVSVEKTKSHDKRKMIVACLTLLPIPARIGTMSCSSITNQDFVIDGMVNPEGFPHFSSPKREKLFTTWRGKRDC